MTYYYPSNWIGEIPSHGDQQTTRWEQSIASVAQSSGNLFCLALEKSRPFSADGSDFHQSSRWGKTEIKATRDEFIVVNAIIHKDWKSGVISTIQENELQAAISNHAQVDNLLIYWDTQYVLEEGGEDDYIASSDLIVQRLHNFLPLDHKGPYDIIDKGTFLWQSCEFKHKALDYKWAHPHKAPQNLLRRRRVN